MDEFVSKKLLVAKFNELASKYIDGDKRQRGLAYTTAADMIALADAADVQPINQWISVKDRLPEENILVLCYARSTTGEGNSYFLGALAHGEFWFLKVNDIGHVSCPVLHWEVTHWQPLPEPPKIGGTDNENS